MVAQNIITKLPKHEHNTTKKWYSGKSATTEMKGLLCVTRRLTVEREMVSKTFTTTIIAAGHHFDNKLPQCHYIKTKPTELKKLLWHRDNDLK